MIVFTDSLLIHVESFISQMRDHGLDSEKGHPK